MASRTATPDDVDAIAQTIALAFASDPVWGPALRRSDGVPIEAEPYWRFFVVGAQRYGTARMATDGAAVSVWVPPGEPELDEELGEALERFIEHELDLAALAALHDLYARFEASRAAQPPHYYLSLLATKPAFRGQGRGQILLAEDLALWDAAGVPAYLESTNPANDHRYARLGFVPVGGFRAVVDGTWIPAMLRPVGGR